MSVLSDGKVAVVGGGVLGPVGVLQRGELVLPDTLPHVERLRKLEDVEYELLHLDAVGPVGLDGLAGLGDVRDLLLGHVVHQLALVLVHDSPQERAGEVVDADVGGGVGQGAVVVAGLGGAVGDLGVLDNLRKDDAITVPLRYTR